MTLDKQFLGETKQYISLPEIEASINDNLLNSMDIVDEIYPSSIQNNLQYVDKDMLTFLKMRISDMNKENNQNNDKEEAEIRHQPNSRIQKAMPLHEIILGERKPSFEEPLPPGTSITRRKRWIEKYLQDIESGEHDKKLYEQHTEMQQRRRKKRSLASGVEGQSFANVSFIIIHHLAISAS